MPSTPIHTTYTSTGCRFPADIAVRKYVRSSNADDGLVRVTPPAKNRSRARIDASSGAGAGDVEVRVAVDDHRVLAAHLGDHALHMTVALAMDGGVADDLETHRLRAG